MPLVLLVIAALIIVPDGDAQQARAEAAAAKTIENTGAPMKLDFQCTREDLRHSGLACTAEDPCPVFLELSAVESAGARIFVAGNIHTRSTTLYSVLLSSEDGGKNWREPSARIRSAVLDRMQFFDFQRGWVGGQLVHALPRDPFLLLTTDGGTTWRRRPVSEESRAGAIENFHFDSRNSGVLWLDRTQSGETDALYERYESMTGGETWMLREVSSRPLFKEDRPAVQVDSGWRLRPDARTESYRIEKWQGEQWQTAASFLIAIGDCSPPEPEPPEPAAEPAPPAEESVEPALAVPPHAPPSLKKSPP